MAEKASSSTGTSAHQAPCYVEPSNDKPAPSAKPSPHMSVAEWRLRRYLDVEYSNNHVVKNTRTRCGRWDKNTRRWFIANPVAAVSDSDDSDVSTNTDGESLDFQADLADLRQYFIKHPDLLLMCKTHKLRAVGKDHGALYNGEIGLWYLPGNHADYDNHARWWKDRNLKYVDHQPRVDLPHLGDLSGDDNIKARTKMKNKGIRFDVDRKVWYIPAHYDLQRFTKYLPPKAKADGKDKHNDETKTEDKTSKAANEAGTADETKSNTTAAADTPASPEAKKRNASTPPKAPTKQVAGKSHRKRRKR